MENETLLEPQIWEQERFMRNISTEDRGLPPGSRLSFVIVLTAFLAVLVMMPSRAHASAQVRLAWQRNPETTVIGYRVYYGYSSGSYRYCRNVGNRRTYLLKRLPVGKTCYIAVAAYDFYGNESKLSKEIPYTPTAQIALGAETGALTPPMVLASDARASGGKYLPVPSGSINLAD
jgi:hypothetical protein